VINRRNQIFEVIMDPVSIGFYAVICGALSAAGPALGGLIKRISAGIVVGAAASWLLPILKTALGSGY
jgi:hypothetical protein